MDEGVVDARGWETEVVSFGPDSVYQLIIGDDAGTTPIRTGIQTAQPSYVAPVNSHPYLEILHILDGAAEAWMDGQEDRKELPGRRRDVLRLLGTYVSPKRIVDYRDPKSDDRGYRAS